MPLTGQQDRPTLDFEDAASYTTASNSRLVLLTIGTLPAAGSAARCSARWTFDFQGSGAAATIYLVATDGDGVKWTIGTYTSSATTAGNDLTFLDIIIPGTCTFTVEIDKTSGTGSAGVSNQRIFITLD